MPSGALFKGSTRGAASVPGFTITRTRQIARALGFDFGTTNSLIAEAIGNETRSMMFESATGRSDTMRTALSFLKKRDLSVNVEAGQAAISQFIDNPGDCRVLQSIKTFAASPLFQSTLIFGRRTSFSDLMATFVERLKTYAGSSWPDMPERLVVGRPVAFAGANPDEQLAISRYSEALAHFGFQDIHFVYEPVAAAFFFSQKLERDATVLVADFGGGTTDYSLIRFERSAGRLSARPLGHSGVGVAGDHFDFRIIDNVVSPEIGKGSTFRSFDKKLDVPGGYYANFGRWNQLSIFKTSKEFQELKKLVRVADEPEKLELFVDLVDHDEGFPLYQAVSATKMALSNADEAEFHFAPLGTAGRKTVRRANFESWIAPELARIEAGLDDVLEKTATAPEAIDKVFLTGGTSFVPAMRRIFHNRFDASRIESGGELLSIAHGLALIGERDDIAEWTA